MKDETKSKRGMTPAQKRRAQALLRAKRIRYDEILRESKRIEEQQQKLVMEGNCLCPQIVTCLDIIESVWYGAWPDWFVEACEEDKQKPILERLDAVHAVVDKIEADPPEPGWWKDERLMVFRSQCFGRACCWADVDADWKRHYLAMADAIIEHYWGVRQQIITHEIRAIRANAIRECLETAEKVRNRWTTGTRRWYAANGVFVALEALPGCPDD